MRSTVFAAALAVFALSLPANADTVADWRWLNGTTWIVPTTGLPAYVYVPSSNVLTPVQDQTVYQITGYRNGYFWGRTSTKLGSGSITCKSLVGSVTPEGKIYLTFTNYPFTEGTESTVGIGNMTRKLGQWTMANQMSTGTSSVQIGHWAYMVQSYPGTTSWASLPGANMSVPSFMQPCLDAAPTTTP
ncbi:hypothetical protein [Aestuariivirga sp.]|uniref:hypothetical protein n=1 Tax=Aestuariivirga sp. TaxID=2650926 RepID=UPI003BABFA88